MKKIIAKIAVTISICVMALLGVTGAMEQPVYAADNKAVPCTCKKPDGTIVQGTRTQTAILGNGDNTNTGCECGKGEGIISVLSLIVNILTIGVGVVGMIGITLVGIQYITAGGNEEKTRKAKRRIFEIVLGLAAYVVVYALLNWLIPGFSLGF